LIIASICVTIALSDSLAWFHRNKKRGDLAFILICLGGASFCLFCSGEYNVDNPIQSIFWLKGEVVASTVSGFALLWFVAEETRLVKPRYLLLCLLWAVLSMLSQVIDLGDLAWIASRPFVLRVELPFGLDFVYKEVERGPVLFVIATAGFLFQLYLLVVVARYRRLGNRKESSVLFVAIGFIVAAQIIDVLVGTGMIRFVFLLEYAWLATILFVGLHRSNDFIEAALTRKTLEKTDRELKVSQATLRTIVDSTADLIWSVDAESFSMLSFNKSFRDHVTERRGLAVSVGMSLEELFPSEDEVGLWRDIYRRAIAEGTLSMERSILGEARIFSLSVNLLGREGGVFGLSVFARDITERKEAEERIRRSLSEKEILLREVHHRTKNNMAVIISMLRLQAREMGDDGLKAAYAVTIDRILAMSSVHDQLYVTGDLARVDLKGYLESLANRLIAGYLLPGDRGRLVLETESIHVTLDTAINCGLIVNELVTNALKHAYPADGRGEIRIRLKRGPDGGISLGVSDEGVGMPPGFDPARDGHLGLRLVRSLAEGKLRGRLEFETRRGFSCALLFAEDSSET
jgi:PAS domain S-box-containing protein